MTEELKAAKNVVKGEEGEAPIREGQKEIFLVKPFFSKKSSQISDKEWEGNIGLFTSTGTIKAY